MRENGISSKAETSSISKTVLESISAMFTSVWQGMYSPG
jgi:hypothetical protein